EVRGLADIASRLRAERRVVRASRGARPRIPKHISPPCAETVRGELLGRRARGLDGNANLERAVVGGESERGPYREVALGMMALEASERHRMRQHRAALP